MPILPKWLCKCTPYDLDIRPKFYPTLNSNPYIEAIDTLIELPFETVPTDAMHVCLRTARSVAAQARMPFSSSPLFFLYLIVALSRLCVADSLAMASDVGADDFLPIFMYVVMQAGLHIANIHQCLALMNRFCSSRERNSELGYCLTSLESAVVYIKGMSEGTQSLFGYICFCIAYRHRRHPPSKRR